MSDRIPTFDEMVARREELRVHEFAEWFFKRYAPVDHHEREWCRAVITKAMALP